MNEIEKMYENAGIKPLPTCSNCNMLDEYWSNGTYCSTCKCDKGNDECGMADYVYPPFIAEKQIELIKFLLKNYEGVDYNDKSFEESLAGVINKLWADMPEEEKQQVKGILE